MSGTVYLSTADVVAINAHFGGSVRDHGIVDSATMRCTHTLAGDDAYPSLFEKAAALLYGLATTQGFIDGNKRTAWTAMETFLAINGRFVRTTTVDAEILVLAIAGHTIGHDQIVEWLTKHERK